MINQIPVHPVQGTKAHVRHKVVPQVVTMKAYEVYCHMYGKQEAMVTGGCRGGFTVGELIGFLYASTFPKEQWAERTQEAWRGMDL